MAETFLAKCFRLHLWNPKNEMLLFQSLPLHVSQSPSLQVPLMKPLQRERCSISKTLLDRSYVAFRVSGKGTLSPGSPAPVERETLCFQKLLESHYLTRRK
jgi:hypothetical protein